MKRKNPILTTVCLACIVTVLTAFLCSAATVQAAETSTVRLGGKNRIATSVRISDAGWSDAGAADVVIANGYSYPDAMAGVPLAAMLDAPVLLTKGDTPEADLLAQLEKLGTGNAVILGGTQRISEEFVSALAGRGITAERIAGSDRYATASAVASRMLELGAQPDEVFIASGSNFPDALSVSSAAGVLTQPILYARPDGSLSDDTVAFIGRSGAQGAVILGGTASVPDGITASLQTAGITDTQRLSGADRYQTSLAINRHYNAVLSGSDVALASGEDFPDALSGSAFAAKKAIPVVLVSNRINIPGAYDYVTGRAPSAVYIFGMEGAISSYAADTFLSGGTITTRATTTTTAKPTTTTKPTQSSTEKVTSAGGKVNVRSGPGTGYNKLGSITPGKYLDVLGSEKGADGNKWYKVRFSGKEGYVLGSLVTTGKVNTNGGSGKKAYLTFDDGPSANTKKILNILDQHNVKATFFVIYRSGYESVYKDIVRRGHTIALHSYTHDYSTIYRSTSAYFKDLNRLSDYVYKLTGERTKIMRFPGGGSNTVSRSYCRGIMTTLTREVQNRGYKYYDWNVDSQDASGNLSASAIVSSVKRSCGSQKNAIVLMHDAPGKGTTVSALPDIIRYLKSKGYELLPITESTPQVHHAVNN